MLISIEFKLPTKVRAKESAQDILQTTLIKAWERRSEFDSSRFKYSVWLRILAEQVIVDAARFHSAQMRDADAEMDIIPNSPADQTVINFADVVISPHSTPLQTITRNERRVRLLETINSLSPTDREAIQLRYLEQRTTEEMAQILGTNEATARKRAQRAFDRLQELILNEKSKWGVSTHGLGH